ncbi:hypothetical protein SK128_012146 [Halocaridina rubra]|uniref:Uncharacterized protein n=1 Tax=Halocaridina rubra TaxID=373956 RepID=A0AAN8WUL3_HALRR
MFTQSIIPSELTEYIPAARTVGGVSSLPGGMEYYKGCLRFHTSTDLTPQQIHDLGLSEVERIQKEVNETVAELGIANKTIAEISNIVKNDPTQWFSSKEELLSMYRDAVYNKIYPLLEQVVHEVPDVNVT